MPISQSHKQLQWLAFSAAAFVTVLVYRPGLHGPLLFDDFANLPPLGAYGRIDNVRSLILYLTAGHADPTGRPLSMASFLLDAQDWPANPYPFKRTNLLVHVANGALLLMLLYRLGRRAGVDEPRSSSVAAFGAACWMLHPLLVSTTLYVIQRQAQLAATFCFAGLLAWDRLRCIEHSGRVPTMWGAMALACWIAATLCKANGALLPLLAIVIDVWLPPPNAARTRWHFNAALVAGGCIVGYIIWTGLSLLDDGVLPYRGWSVAQRLLTEPRVLCRYLAQTFWPALESSGPFNDHIAISTSPLQPLTTLPAILVVLSLMGVAWALRQRMPAVALAIAFFFAGHLLESTSIPLELSFEHRNYLPICLFAWALGMQVHSIKMAWSARVTGIVAPLILAALTFARAHEWGNAALQAHAWADAAPMSGRAQAYAAGVDIDGGRPAAALDRLDDAIMRIGAQPQLVLSSIEAECGSGSVRPGTIDVARDSLHATRNPGALEATSLARLLDIARRSRCAGLDVDAVEALTTAFATNPVVQANAGRRQDALQLHARIALTRGDVARASALLQDALIAQPRPDMALAGAAILADAGYGCEALAFLDAHDPARLVSSDTPADIRRIQAWWQHRSGYWSEEASSLHHRITTSITGRCRHAQR